MAYENKPRTISDKNRERSEEERTSLARQRGRRELNERKKQLQRQEDQELSRAGSRKERNEIRARADAALEQAEANFNETYKKLSARYTPEIAEYMDQEGFITGNPNDYANIEKDLGANDNFNETKLESYLETTNAGSYESRKESRVSAIQDR